MSNSDTTISDIFALLQKDTIDKGDLRNKIIEFGTNRCCDGVSDVKSVVSSQDDSGNIVNQINGRFQFLV